MTTKTTHRVNLAGLTTAHIERLRAEAAAAGDLAQVAICDRARSTVRATTRREPPHASEHWLDCGQPQWLEPYASREEADAAILAARAECVFVINAARAMEER